MAQTVCVLAPAEDRERLLAIVADRNRPLKHVRRAHIVLCSADRLPVQEVARRASVSRPAVWRWQARYAEQGVEGLLRDKTRKPGRAPLSAKVVAKVLDLTCSEPPGMDHFRQSNLRKTRQDPCTFSLSQCTRRRSPQGSV